MDITSLITGVLVGLAVGGLLTWLAVRADVTGLRVERACGLG